MCATRNNVQILLQFAARRRPSIDSYVRGDFKLEHETSGYRLAYLGDCRYKPDWGTLAESGGAILSPRHAETSSLRLVVNGTDEGRHLGDFFLGVQQVVQAAEEVFATEAVRPERVRERRVSFLVLMDTPGLQAPSPAHVIDVLLPDELRRQERE